MRRLLQLAMGYQLRVNDHENQDARRHSRSVSRSAGRFFPRRLLGEPCLTVIVTGCFIPIGVYELTRRLTGTRRALLGVNVAVVWYLIAVLRYPEAKEGVRP